VRYAVVIEEVVKNYSAYVPDLQGCVAAGEAVAEVETLIAQAMALHLEGIREDGITPPLPSVNIKMVEAV
jgi:predicted RNase H-like HicB family nuclease